MELIFSGPEGVPDFCSRFAIQMCLDSGWFIFADLGLALLLSSWGAPNTPGGGFRRGALLWNFISNRQPGEEPTSVNEYSMFSPHHLLDDILRIYYSETVKGKTNPMIHENSSIFTGGGESVGCRGSGRWKREKGDFPFLPLDIRHPTLLFTCHSIYGARLCMK